MGEGPLPPGFDQSGARCLTRAARQASSVTRDSSARAVFPIAAMECSMRSGHRIGLLFIDFETPNRLRVQGAAEVLFDHPLLEIYPGAQFLIAVAVESIWVNSALHPSAPQTRAVEIRARSWPGTAFACMETDRHRAGGTGEGRPRRWHLDAYAELLAKGEA